jgi:hypothetical protein
LKVRVELELGPVVSLSSEHAALSASAASAPASASTRPPLRSECMDIVIRLYVR